MAIYWCGGEDIDYASLGSFSITTTTTFFRSAFARCAIGYTTGSATVAKSNVFPGGALTSAWLSYRFYNTNLQAASKGVGFGLSGGSKSLCVAGSAASSTKVALIKYDGTTRTELATESGTSLANNTLHRIDMQVVSYGASATVNVFVDNVQVISFSGDVTVSGMTNFDSVFAFQDGASGANFWVSEIVVTDFDTRSLLGLQTMALTGAGTTNDWTGTTFSNINGTTISDASPTSTNTSAKDNQYNITDPSSALYTVAACKISARMAVSAAPTPTKVKLGYNSGGSIAFGTGATKTLTAAYVNYEQFDATNPVTGVAFVQSEMNALQVDLQSTT